MKKNCINNSERPRITFDKRGWCNACVWMEEKKKVNWKKRKKELTHDDVKREITNNNVFVGSTTDLQRMLLDERDEVTIIDAKPESKE